MRKEVPFENLRGKVLTKVTGLEKDSDVVTFEAEDGSVYEMYHEQDCCESVSIEDVCGDVDDLIGSEILLAEEVVSDEWPEGVEKSEWVDSFTWTFYKLATRKGFVDIRWYGESNGYYSESVDFIQTEPVKQKERVKVFAKTLEESAEKQVKEMSESEAYGDCTVRIMPDCHAGKGCTIGTVIEVKDRIVPNTVGVDIGCGMYVREIPFSEIDLQRLDEVINTYIPSGFSIHEKKVWSNGYLEVNIKNLKCINVIDVDMALRSIGTLGGGNHFIEVNKDKNGKHWLVIHSGSRNLGKRVCEYWQKVAEEKCMFDSAQRKQLIETLKAEGRQDMIEKAIKEFKPKVKNKDLAYLAGRDALNYLSDMEYAQHYASINRTAIADIIFEHMGWRNFRCHDFHTVHNYIDTDLKILRKGAVKAEAGQELIIPMNMRDGSLLCIGKGNDDWLCSAPHGAGRLMSRKQALDNLKMEDFEREMSDVYSTSVCRETIDESPMAYKPMQEILDCIGDTVQVVDIIKPIYNFKAKTPEKPDWKAQKHKVVK